MCSPRGTQARTRTKRAICSTYVAHGPSGGKLLCIAACASPVNPRQMSKSFPFMLSTSAPSSCRYFSPFTTPPAIPFPLPSSRVFYRRAVRAAFGRNDEVVYFEQLAGILSSGWCLPSARGRIKETQLSCISRYSSTTAFVLLQPSVASQKSPSETWKQLGRVARNAFDFSMLSLAPLRIIQPGRAGCPARVCSQRHHMLSLLFSRSSPSCPRRLPIRS